MYRGIICPGNAVNQAHPLNRGLVSRWMNLPNRLGGGGVTFRDLMGRNHGTLTNGPTWKSALGRPGGFGSIKIANATSQYVGLVRPNWTGISAFTTSYWIYLPTGSPTEYGNYFGMWDGGSAVTQILHRWSGGMQCFVNSDGGSASATATNTLFAIPGWNLVTFVADGTTLRTYVGATASGTGSLSGPYIPADTNNTPWVLGGQCRGTTSDEACWDDVALWSRALSAGEVAARLQDSRRGSPETLNWQRRATVFDMGGGGGGGGYSAWWRDHGSRLIGGGIT